MITFPILPMSWCWVVPKYICPDQPDRTPLDEALKIFSTGEWEYVAGGRGQYDPENEKYETDCKYLVDTGLEAAGFHPTGWLGFGVPIPGASGPYVITSNDYFCLIPCQKAGPGDIVLLAAYKYDVKNNTYDIYVGNHEEYISSPVEPGDNGGWTSQVFEATRFFGGPHLGRQWNSQGDFFYYEGAQYEERLIGVYRPKKKIFVEQCIGFPAPPKNAPPPPPLDPLILDLNGNGIQTLGMSAGIHFDNDGNGFQELTGWVAQGDGMLMLDKNNNGRLDDGSELFGDFTILPNGTRAANGFQALAYYDANGDGKIDANDPIKGSGLFLTHIEPRFDVSRFAVS
ncbi:MAG: hypothetical protein WBG50_18275 [Desulfomonilaceae bacterium]